MTDQMEYKPYGSNTVYYFQFALSNVLSTVNEIRRPKRFSEKFTSVLEKAKSWVSESEPSADFPPIPDNYVVHDLTAAGRDQRMKVLANLLGITGDAGENAFVQSADQFLAQKLDKLESALLDELFDSINQNSTGLVGVARDFLEIAYNRTLGPEVQKEVENFRAEIRNQIASFFDNFDGLSSQEQDYLLRVAKFVEKAVLAEKALDGVRDFAKSHQTGVLPQAEIAAAIGATKQEPLDLFVLAQSEHTHRGVQNHLNGIISQASLKAYVADLCQHIDSNQPLSAVVDQVKHEIQLGLLSDSTTAETGQLIGDALNEAEAHVLNHIPAASENPKNEIIRIFAEYIATIKPLSFAEQVQARQKQANLEAELGDINARMGRMERTLRTITSRVSTRTLSAAATPQHTRETIGPTKSLKNMLDEAGFNQEDPDLTN
mgnify:CR=1 FL=1